MFGWLRKRKARAARDAHWQVVVTTDTISVGAPGHDVVRLAKAELSAVAIEIGDGDRWWLLFGADGERALAFPHGATGEVFAIDYLAALGGFDQRAMTRAMRSRRRHVFPVWQRNTVIAFPSSRA